MTFSYWILVEIYSIAPGSAWLGRVGPERPVGWLIDGYDRVWTSGEAESFEGHAGGWIDGMMGVA
jgi:hypothetical protein